MKKKTFDLNKHFITMILVILAIATVVEAVQINAIKQQSIGSEVKTEIQNSNTKTTTENSLNVPKSIENLPQMVGGC